MPRTNHPDFALGNRIYVSLPWAEIVEPPPDGNGIIWSRRKVDWGLSGPRSRLQHIAGGLRILVAGRYADTIVVCHAGMDVVVAGLTHRLLCRSIRLVVVDFLLPRKTPRPLLRAALRGVDEFVVIRSGDATVLRGLEVATDDVRYVAFAASAPLITESTEIGNFVYSGGAAQRDWATLSEAFGKVDIPAVVSCTDNTQVFTSNVRNIGIVTPEEGREYVRKCRFLVQAVIDNQQPSGPLLILDAFSAGKPVVASDVSGTRDYVQDGINGVLVAPGNSSALADAMSSLYSDDGRVRRMSAAARITAAELSPTRFWHDVLGPYGGPSRAET